MPIPERPNSSAWGVNGYVQGAIALPEVEFEAATVLPKREMTYRINGRLTFEGNKLRYEYEGERPQLSTGKLVRSKYLSVFDGVEHRFFKAASSARPHPKGEISAESRSLDIDSLELEALWVHCRPSLPFLPTSTARGDWTVLPTQEVVNGRECRVLSHRDTNARWKVWVDPLRNFLVVRYELFGENDVVLQETEISYVDDATHGWLPAEWTTVRNNPNGSHVSTLTAKVTDSAINLDVSPDEFKLEFPAGTLVQDLKRDRQYIQQEEGKTRPIVPSDRGSTVEQIAATEPGEVVQADGPGPLWIVNMVALFALTVLLIGRVLWKKRQVNP